MLDRKIEIRGKERVVIGKTCTMEEALARLPSDLDAAERGHHPGSWQCFEDCGVADLDELEERGREHADEIRQRAEKCGNQRENIVAADAASKRGADARSLDPTSGQRSLVARRGACTTKGGITTAIGEL